MVFCRSGLSKQNIGDASNHIGLVGVRVVWWLRSNYWRWCGRANTRPRATSSAQLQPKNCITNLWRALSPPQERSGRGSYGLTSWFGRGFDSLGMRRHRVGRWVVVGYACLLAWWVGDGRSKLVSLTAARSICSQHLAARSS